MGLPPVVLVHGLASSAEHGWRDTGWTDLLGDFGRQVRAVDLPGHGSAGRSADPADYDDVAAEVAAQVGAAGAVDAVGFSVGAYVLVECAVRGLLACRRLALLGVGADMLSPPSGAQHELAERIESGDGVDPGARLFRRMIESAGNDPAAISAFLRRTVRPIDPADVAAIGCPVLVVTGDRDPAGPGESLAAAFPEGIARPVRGVDHFSTPGDVRVIEAVLDFLAG